MTPTTLSDTLPPSPNFLLLFPTWESMARGIFSLLLLWQHPPTPQGSFVSTLAPEIRQLEIRQNGTILDSLSLCIFMAAGPKFF